MLLLLLLGVVADQAGTDHGGFHAAGWRVVQHRLFTEDYLLDENDVESAVFFRPCHGQPAVFGELLLELSGIACLAFGSGGAPILLEKLLDQLLERVLFLVS